MSRTSKYESTFECIRGLFSRLRFLSSFCGTVTDVCLYPSCPISGLFARLCVALVSTTAADVRQVLRLSHLKPRRKLLGQRNSLMASRLRVTIIFLLFISLHSHYITNAMTSVLVHFFVLLLYASYFNTGLTVFYDNDLH